MKVLRWMRKSEREAFKIPKKVQDVLPVKKVFKDGIFYIGNDRYSKTFKFSDINYHIASDEEKEDLMRGYWSVINSFGSGVIIKLTINNHKLDKAEFENSILIPHRDDGLDKYRDEYNQMLIDKAEQSNSIVQDKYFTVTVTKSNIDEARAFFNRIGSDLASRMSRVGSKSVPLSADERLKILHDFYREGQEQNFNISFDALDKSNCSPIDYVCPDSMEFESDHIKINGKYYRTIFLRNYGTFISDDIIPQLTSFNINLMLSVDFVPVPNDEATREVDKVLLGIQTDKANYNRKQVQNNNIGAINYDLEQREQEILEVKTDMRSRDQKLYFGLITMVVSADSLKELKEITETIFSKVAEGSTSQFAILRYQQLDGLNTVLPFGVKKIHTMRTLTTESLAAFIPFNAQEVQHKNGIYYGQNSISNNMIFVNRTELMNGNCLDMGVPGGGKSFFVKNDILNIILSDPMADVIIIDPEREYNRLVNSLNGEVIDISATSSNHINAMDMNAEYADDNNPIATKAEFIMSLCEQLLAAPVGAKDKSIIDRCCRSVYADYITNEYRGEPPTLKDFRDELLHQPEIEAHELALAIEMFVDGSLNTFAQPTNVDTSNRLICYDILDLGEQLLPVGMLVVLDSILNRITSNRAKGRRTYIFIDEIYLLFKQKYTADFLYTLWKRVRKYGAFATGITQNVGDMLESNTARSMLANSEFVVMLNQASTDRLELAKLLNITSNQMEFFTNVKPGHGLMKVGSELIPFANEFPHNELYKLMTTKPGEV